MRVSVARSRYLIFIALVLILGCGSTQQSVRSDQNQSVPENEKVEEPQPVVLPDLPRDLEWLSETVIVKAGFSPPDHTVFRTLEKMPELFEDWPLEYPVEAKRRSVQGTVWIQSWVSKTGEVMAARVARAAGPPLWIGFEWAALRSAVRKRYTPAIEDGLPTGTWITHPVHFKIDAE